MTTSVALTWVRTSSTRLVELLVGWSGDDVAAHYGLWTGRGEFSSRTSSTIYLPVVPDSWGRLLARLLCRSSTPTHEGPDFAFVSSCPVIEWFRDVWLFDGPLTAVTAIGSTSAWDDNELWRRSPQWWWPTDRSWFVANEIDWPWSYIAGPAALIDWSSLTRSWKRSRSSSPTSGERRGAP